MVVAHWKFTFALLHPWRVNWGEKWLGVWNGKESWCVWCPIDAIDDDTGVGGDLSGKVWDVPFRVFVKLGCVEPATVLPFELVFPPDLEKKKLLESYPNIVVFRVKKGYSRPPPKDWEWPPKIRTGSALDFPRTFSQRASPPIRTESTLGFARNFQGES